MQHPTVYIDRIFKKLELSKDEILKLKDMPNTINTVNLNILKTAQLKNQTLEDTLKTLNDEIQQMLNMPTMQYFWSKYKEFGFQINTHDYLFAIQLIVSQDKTIRDLLARH